MSIRIIEQVFNSDLKPTQKFIMIALADNANNEGVCFPSISTIMKKTGYSKPTIINNIDDLSKNGYILKKHRNRKKGGRSSSKYLIFPATNSSILSEEDYHIFEDMLTQSKAPLLPPQSKAPLLPPHSQSKAPLLESEPSLNINHHLLRKAEEEDKRTIQEILHTAWNSFAQQNGLNMVRKMTGTRKGKILKRDKEFDNLEHAFKLALDKISESRFLLGENDRGWKVDFDFLFTNDTNIVHIVEGKYDN